MVPKIDLESLYRRFAQDGDVSALAEVFDRVAPDLLRLARRLVRDQSRAEDIVQETFVTAIARPDTYDSARQLRPWLLGILVNRARDDRKREARVVAAERLADREVHEPLVELCEQECRATIEGAVAELPPNLKAVVEGRLVEGREARELADELGLTANALRQRLHRGVLLLRGVLPAGLAPALLPFLLPRKLLAVRVQVLEEGAKAASSKAAVLHAGSWVAASSPLRSLAMGAAILTLGASALLFWKPDSQADAHGDDRSVLDPVSSQVAVTATETGTQPGPIGERVTTESPAESGTESAVAGVLVVGVTKAEAGLAATGIVVRIAQGDEADPSFRELTVGEDGRAHFADIAGDIIYVEALATAATSPVRAWLRRAIEDGKEEAIELVVHGGYTLAGLVVDHEERPVAGAEVVVWCEEYLRGEPHRRTQTDNHGRFVVEHAGPKFIAKASTDALVCFQGLQGKLEGDTVTGDGLLIRVGPSSRLIGTVKDPQSRPVAGVEVAINDEGGGSADHLLTLVAGVSKFQARRGRTVSAADGSFGIDRLPTGSVFVTAKKSPFLVSRGYHQTGQEPVTIALDPGLFLRGRVSDSMGRAAEGAEVIFGPYYGNVQTTSASVFCDKEGRFLVAGMLPEETLYEVSDDQRRSRTRWIAIVHEGHAVRVVQPIEPTPSATGPPLEVHLELESPLTGRVGDDDGEPIAGSRLSVEGEREVHHEVSYGYPFTWEAATDRKWTVSDEDGSFRFSNLYPGTFRLRAYLPGDNKRFVELEVQSGSDGVEMILGEESLRKVVLTGNVRDALTGEPIRRFEVVPFLGSMGRSYAFEDEEGRFEVSGLSPGGISVDIRADGYSTLRIERRTYSLGEHQLTARLAPARTLVLVVVDEEGSRIDGFSGRVTDPDGRSLLFGWESQSDHFRSIDGRAILHGLPAGPFRVSLDVDGIPYIYDFDLTNPIEREYQIVVARVRSIHATVLFVIGENDEARIELITSVELRQRFKQRPVYPTETIEFGFSRRGESTLASGLISVAENGEFTAETTRRTATGATGSRGEDPEPSASRQLPAGELRLRVVVDGREEVDSELQIDRDRVIILVTLRRP